MDAKLQALNQIALKNGFKDWNDLWWRGDITVDIMEDVLDTYGKIKHAEGMLAGVKLADAHRLGQETNR